MDSPAQPTNMATSGMKTIHEKLASLSYGLVPRADTAIDDELVRQRQGFPQVESSLPDQIGGTSESTADRVLSFFLGDHNPLAQEATPETDVVWLLDNTAYRPKGDEQMPWEAEFVAAYFVRHTGKDLSKAVATIADILGVDDGEVGGAEAARAKIEQRLRPFALNIRPARYVKIGLDKGEILQLGPSNSNGLSSQILKLGERDGQALQSAPVLKQLDSHAPASTFFAKPSGWAVISDIDDSIKITMTSSPIGVLQSTFYDEPTPITGMPELYEYLESKFKPDWFYLSASPYTLYTFLQPFLQAHYPLGTTILREASWQDLTGLLQSFTVGTEAYKAKQIEKIYSWLPLKKAICVGDTTQSDPEAYGDIARRHPDWIKAIFIRKVQGVEGMEETEKNSPQRFEKAFRDVPRDKWRLFEGPQELYQAVDSLMNI